MMDRFDKIESKLDKMNESLHNIDVSMARNTESLEQHMKRTDLLEKLIVGVIIACFSGLGVFFLK